VTLAYDRGFESRATCGLVPPRSVSRNLDTSRHGSTVHYGGPAQRLPATVPHVECRRRWRSWQAFHMAPGGLGTANGAADIAYNIGHCQHGIRLAGRGHGVRSGANGSTDGNYGSEAFVFLTGGAEAPTLAAQEAMALSILEVRERGGSWTVSPHSRWTSTGCPGATGRIFAAALDGSRIVRRFGTPPPPPPPPPSTDWLAMATEADLDRVLRRAVREEAGAAVLSSTVAGLARSDGRPVDVAWLLRNWQRLFTVWDPTLRDGLGNVDVDLDELAAAVREGLGDEVARALAERLARSIDHPTG
jgi:hypothetical protein